MGCDFCSVGYLIDLVHDDPGRHTIETAYNEVSSVLACVGLPRLLYEEFFEITFGAIGTGRVSFSDGKFHVGYSSFVPYECCNEYECQC